MRASILKPTLLQTLLFGRDQRYFSGQVFGNGFVGLHGSAEDVGPFNGHATLADNLISYWKLDEASGQRNDSHSTNHLTDNNTVLAGTGLLNANAADFESSNSEYLSHADNAELSFSADQAFTIQLLFKPESSTAAQCLVSKNDGGAVDDGYLLFFNTNNTFTFHLGNNSSQTSVTSTDTIADGALGMVTIDHDPVADTIGLTINAGTRKTAAWSNGTYDNGSAFNVGRRVDNTSMYTDGLIEGLGFWKKVQSASERSDRWNGGSGLDY